MLNMSMTMQYPPLLLSCQAYLIWIESMHGSICLQIKGVDIYRMKGVVEVKGEDHQIVFQGVHMIFGSQAGKPHGIYRKRSG